MKRASKKPRVLHILPGLKKCGGMESFVLNYYRELSDRVDFCFAVFGDIDGEYASEVSRLGGEVKQFGAFSLGSLSLIKKQFKEYLDNNQFDIVHCHMANAAFALLPIAKKTGIKVRIIHSHQNKYSDKLSHSIRNFPLVEFGLFYANAFLACSKEAGDFLFGKRHYTVINNAIAPEKYSFNKVARKSIRKKYGIKDDQFLIGHVGRFEPQKNHSFIIDCFKQLHDKLPESQLLLVGEGELLENTKKAANAYGIGDSVHFAGSVANVGDYLSSFDAFIFPSLYEGLGIACVEAQCSGLHVVASKEVPKESCIFDDLIDYIDLSKPEEWSNSLLSISASLITNNRSAISSNFTKSKYNIHNAAEDLMVAYKKLISEYSK